MDFADAAGVPGGIGAPGGLEAALRVGPSPAHDLAAAAPLVLHEAAKDEAAAGRRGVEAERVPRLAMADAGGTQPDPARDAGAAHVVPDALLLREVVDAEAHVHGLPRAVARHPS